MIPYLPQPEINIFGFTIYAFSILVLLSILVGYTLCIRRTKACGLNTKVMSNVLDIMIPVSLTFAAVFQTLWYNPDVLTMDNWYKLSTWSGISSYAGFMGAAIVCIIYFSRKSTPKFIEYADVILYGFVAAWVIARIGCFFAHDHPGVPSNFILAIDYPSGVFGGVSRHNLGLYEALYSLAIFLYLHFGLKKGYKQGFPISIVFISYSIVRFFLEYLRATDLPGSDLRYLSLTPAQWGCFVLFFIGVYYYMYSRKSNTPYIISNTSVKRVH